MKAVLISIQPKWVEKIASGEKTIEVRKTKPNLQTPFKRYIYMTKAKPYWFEFVGGGKMRARNGMVIGEFVCDMIDELHEWELTPSNRFYEKEEKRLDLFLKESCLSYKEICDYRENLSYIRPLYGWHISDLKIYDQPKELREFEFPKDNIYLSYRKRNQYFKGITRPPQSYMFVEELKSKEFTAKSMTRDKQIEKAGDIYEY